MGATCGTCGGEEWSFCTKFEEKRPLGFSRHVWEGNESLPFMKFGDIF